MGRCVICGAPDNQWGDRCTKCESTSYAIWGFGEGCEWERQKNFTYKEQRALIFRFRKFRWLRYLIFYLRCLK